ncbi:MAG: DUF418 domain-containing protein [Cytophagales bacterium]|nr:DUF418 domain-containing protein [Armatimonadota bacterium]
MNNAFSPADVPAAPTRDLLPDVLRGIALLGILFVNFEYYSLPSVFHPQYKSVVFPGIADRTATWLINCFAEGKFILIFSFLFGYGLTRQMESARVGSASPLSRYRRRLLGLFLIGLAHAVFLFVGDILVTYALLGLLLIPFRSASPRRLLRAAAFCGLLSLIGHAILGASFSPGTLDREAASQVVAIYAQGSFSEIILQRLRELVYLYAATPLLFAPSVFGLFLLGVWAGRTGLLQDSGMHHKPLLKRITGWCLPLGLIGNAIYATLLQNETPELFLPGTCLRAVVVPLLGFAYLSGITLLLQKIQWRRYTGHLVLLGRLSLSNYLFESIMGCLIFTRYGLGLYGKVGPAAGLIFVLGIHGIQILLSHWWLRRYSIGPAEWLLRWFITLPTRNDRSD